MGKPTSNTTGVLVFLIGLLTAATGFVIGMAGAEHIGWAMAWIGVIVGAGGLIFHMTLLFSNTQKRDDREPK